MFEKNLDDITFLTDKWPLSENLETIFFVHGAGSSSLFWKHQLKSLSDSFNIVAVDLPGHGKNAGGALKSIDEMAHFVEKVILKLKINSPVISGLSMGGAVSLKLMLDGKIKYKAGILVNTGAKLKVHDMIFDLIKNDFEGYVNSFDFAALSKKTDRSEVDFVIEDLRGFSPETVTSDFLACNDFDVMERLCEIKVPTFVLTGDEDKLAPKKFGKHVADSIADSKYVNVEDAGHMIPVEKPEKFNSLITDFLKQLKNS